MCSETTGGLFGAMTNPDPFSPERRDSRLQKRVVVLMLAPRLHKCGTSEGKRYGLHSQVLEPEVETAIVWKNLRKAFYKGSVDTSAIDRSQRTVIGKGLKRRSLIVILDVVG